MPLLVQPLGYKHNQPENLLASRDSRSSVSNSAGLEATTALFQSFSSYPQLAKMANVNSHHSQIIATANHAIS